MLSRTASRGYGFSKLVSTGNEADVDVADFIDILLDDPATSVIALYIEGLRKPAAFRASAQRAAQLCKPLVAFKVGRSESGARSAVSHTGALAGSDRLYDALFAQCGVFRAQTFADLLDIPAALCTGRRLAGKRIAILTSTGGAGTLVADRPEEHTSEIQSLLRISYAVFCLKKKKQKTDTYKENKSKKEQK